MFTIPVSLMPSSSPSDICTVLDQLRSDLAERSLDKRRAAIALLERQIRLWARLNPNLITKLIRTVICDLCSDISACKSALLALSVSAITLQNNPEALTVLYSQSVYSVISIIRSGNSLRHIFLACECLYNISKVCRHLMIDYIADIFSAVVGLITYNDRTIRSATEHLNMLMKDVLLDDRTSRINVILPFLEKILLRNDPYSRHFALCWIRLLHCSNRISILFSLPAVLTMLTDQHPDITVNARSFIESIWHDVPPVQCLPIITKIAAERNQASAVRQIALKWMQDLIHKIPTSVESTLAITIIVQCLDDPNEQISNVAFSSHQDLFKGLKNSCAFIDLDSITGPRSQTAALEFLLAYVRRGETFTGCQNLQQRLLRILVESPLREIGCILEILIRIAMSQNKLVNVLRDLIRTINCSRESILEKKRCTVIVNSLSELLGGHVFFNVVASLPNSELSPMTVHTMLLAIFLSDSLLEFRMHLQLPSSSDIFCRLFSAWISNPVALIGLCLFSRVYELAFLIIVSFLPNFWSIDTFEQIVQLIELVDSPAFFKMRLDILDIQSHPFLFKSLYGLLAVIPHCPCALLLNERLQSAMLSIQLFTSRQRQETVELNVDIDAMYKVFSARNRKGI